MKANIYPSTIQGAVIVPPSKSVTQRIYALALMNKGITTIFNYGNSEDELVALEVVKNCGAKISYTDEALLIESTGILQPGVLIDFRESGLSSRLFTPLLATCSNEIHLIAKGSLLRREMKTMINLMIQLQVKVVHQNAHFPVTIKGPMKIDSIELDASTSSQHITGFLYALSNKATCDLQIHLKNPVSKPYIALSIDWLKRFGHLIEENESLDHIIISPRQEKERNFKFQVESDWSSASFLIVAALLAGDLHLTGLDIHSLQADKKILEVLQIIQADYNWKDKELSVRKMDHIPTFHFDATDCPDLFPPLAVLASFANGKTKIKGVSRLTNKESDRGLALQQELGKLGVVVSLTGDEMIIEGNGKLKGGKVDAHHDHRIAMALSVAALKASEVITVEGIESVNKSFPEFFNILKELHVRMDYA